MSYSRNFFRGAAICSFASTVTTLGLIFLPRFYPPVESFDDRMALVRDPAYLLRSWVYFVHPFITTPAALAVAVRQRARVAGAATLGLLGFLLWGATEAAQQALTKVAFDGTWRAAWPTADEATRALIRSHVEVYDALWNAMYFLILVGFMIGNTSLALAMRREQGLGRWVAVAFLAATLLTLFDNFLPELGVTIVPASVGPWLYPAIQPLGRTLIGVWLLRVSREGVERTTSS